MADHVPSSLVENNENDVAEIIEVTTPSTKRVKRIASSPPDSDAKKLKVEHDEIVLDDASPVKSTPATPKTPKTPKISKEEREQQRLQRLEEKEKQRIERDRLAEEKRLEKERQQEEKRLEKEKREKEKLEKKQEEDRKKEEKRREVEEKKKKEDEEKAKKKKEEEDKKEAKRIEEEEKKEAKKKEEEAVEEKKRRESARFLGFFSKVEKKKPAVPDPDSDCWYRPFEVKDGMTLAPVLMRDPVPSDMDLLKHMDDVTKSTYLTTEKVKNRKITSSRKIEMRAKLIQFHDNRRPPYYGTFRKRPQAISGRRPFGAETGIDYEVVSDDDWEDEPSDGEECKSDEEEEGGEEDAASDDEGFFVPPCYLSDGEGEDEASDGEAAEKRKERKEEQGESARGAREQAASVGQSNVETENAEERRARLAARAKEWSRRVSRSGPAQLVSRCIGPCFDKQISLQTPTGDGSVAGNETKTRLPLIRCPDEFLTSMKAIRLY